jgi:KUP system potassium uptake protein
MEKAEFLFPTVKQNKWLIVPAIIGGSALLVDVGVITPDFCSSSAVEGIRTYFTHL